MNDRRDPDGLRLPVKLDTTTNGELAPVPLEPDHEYANRLAAGDRVGRERATYRGEPDPGFLTYGPKTRRELMNLLRWSGGHTA